MYYNTPYDSNPYTTKTVNTTRSQFPANPMYGQSYVPFQTLDKVFDECLALKKGTLFPELVSPYVPGQSMREIAYIKNANKKEGICQC